MIDPARKPARKVQNDSAAAESENQRATAEILKLAEAITNGQWDARGDPAAFSGGAADLIAAVNQMLDALIGPLRLAANSLDQIAHGNIPEFVVEEYRGEFNNIKKNVNTFLATMYGMHHEVDNFVHAIKNGKLLVRGNDWDFEGRWKDMIAGLNEVIDTFMDPFQVSADYISRISKGDIPETIRGGYKGGFNELRRNLNTLIGAVEALVADAGELSNAAIAGHLATRVDPSRHGGDFRRVVDGVNKTMDAVIGPLNQSAVILGNVARGDLTADLEGDYQGDFARLQRDINRMVANLRSSILGIGQTAERLAAASCQLAGISEQLTGSAGVTSARAKQASSACRQVARNVEAVAAGSETISASIGEIAKQAGEASSTTTGAVKTADDAGQTIRNLDDSSRNIGKVIRTLGAITGQTGALAQQADQQAARAAEAGRGFGVVADEVKRLAQRTREAAEEIDAKTGEFQAVIRRLAGNGGAAGGEDAWTALSGSGKEIGKAVQIISSLAMQTHLLSLNANIEAARAEEAGKRFSGVAMAVKDLSGETSQAAGDIGKQLEAIQRDGGAAVAAVGEIGGIVHRIDSVSHIIAGAVQDQAATAEEMRGSLNTAAEATRQVVEGVAAVEVAAHDTTAAAKETQAAAADLSGMAEKLQLLVGNFKV